MRKSPTSFLIVFLFAYLFFLPNFSVFAYDPKTTHPNLTEITVDFYNQYFSNNVLNETEKQLLMQGSIDEDDGIRWINHFYDPVFNKTWQFEGVEHLFPALTAKEWGQNPFAQAIYDPVYSVFIGPIAKSPVFSKANFTWQQAIYKYIKGNRVEAFNALGHILHLIQDISVPEHTRQNVHIFFMSNAGSPYEVYTAKSNKDFYEQTRKSIENRKPVRKATLDEYFDEIALYSNNYFYSPDTISSSKYKLPQPVFSEVPEIKNGKTYFYVLGEDENHNIFHLALILKNNIGWRLSSGPTVFSLEDDQVLQDYWQRLSKKAVLNGAGVIDLFFQEVEDAKSKSDFISKNENNVLTAMIGGLSGFINDIFQKDSDFIIIDDISDNSVVTTTEDSNSVIATQSSNNTTTTKQTTTTIKTPTTTTKLSTTTTKPTTTTTKPTTTTTTKLTTTTTQSQLQVNICNFITFQTPLRNKIIINEVAWMGTQNSANDEWIELKNVSSQEMNLSGWQLLDKDEQIKVVFQEGSKIPAYGFYLLERTDDDSVPFIAADYIYVGSLANQNEGLRLFDSSCQLEDEILSLPDWSAGDNSSKRTMERKSNFTWQTSAVINGTPKRENSTGYFAPSSGSSASSPVTTTTTTTTTTKPSTTTTTTTLPIVDYPKILINEIKIAGKDEDAKTVVYDEFIELFNPNEFEVDLTGWYLQKKTSQSSDFSSLVPSALFDGEIINSLGYLLIVHSSSTDASIADILISNYSVTDNNTLILKDPNREIVDKVGLGEANDYEVNCAIHPEPGQSIQRKYVDGNFLDSDNNVNDFEIQNCPSPKSLFSNNCFPEETTTTTTTRPPITSTPAIPYITEFSWHPFTKDSSKIVVDFRINSYPFIPSTNSTRNIFTAMAFYIQSDFDDPSVNFGIPTSYLGGKSDWRLYSDTPGLLLSYPNYVSSTRKIGSIIFTADANMAAGSAVPRKYSYQIDRLPNDNHFVVDVTGTTNGQSLNFTPDQYITIGYYGYANSPSSYLKLIAYDNTKFYFNPSNYYHQPTNVLDFEAGCDNEICNNLIFSWTPALDEDSMDILKYDIHYVFAKQGDDLSNNDLTRESWQWSRSQNVLGEPIFNAQTNKFQLQVSINDIHYINAKRLPGVPLDVFFGIKAQDSEGLKSEIPKIFFLNILPIVPGTTTTTEPPTTTTIQPPTAQP